ncbi:MAG TPA: hypothetical protein VIF14_18020 [Alphaproteobacteria bacterium]
MALLRSLGALSFVLGVTLLALDAARSFKIGRFEATSVERFWTNIGGDDFFQLRFRLAEIAGGMSDKILDLPAAFVAFGLGMVLLIFADGAQRENIRKPLLF